MSPALRGWSLTVTILLLAWLGFVQTSAAQLGNPQIEQQFNKVIKGKLAELILNADKKKEKDFPHDVLDGAAQYWVHRVTWPWLSDVKPDSGGTDPFAKHVAEFQAHINKQVLPTKANDPAFVKAYSPVLVARFKELTDLKVVENARPIVYGMQMLPTFAKLQDDSINKYLLELLDPKVDKHDVIKLGAIKALREFPPVDAWGDPSDITLLQDVPKMARKDADLKRVDLLTQFILRPAPKLAKADEIEAYRYLRREAIETLAEAKAPAVAAIKHKKEVEGPIADVLLRVLIPGAMSPETNLYEQNEAALGLCYMKPLDKYDPAPTYYFINKALFDLCQDYSSDIGNIAGGEKRVPPKFPWKITIKRWEAALRQLVANADKSSPADKKKAEFIRDRATPILKMMFDKQRINPNDIAPVATMAPPAEFFLFKSTIKSTPLKWDGAK